MRPGFPAGHVTENMPPCPHAVTHDAEAGSSHHGGFLLNASSRFQLIQRILVMRFPVCAPAVSMLSPDMDLKAGPTADAMILRAPVVPDFN
jgi:hypothetical protein